MAKVLHVRAAVVNALGQISQILKLSWFKLI